MEREEDYAELFDLMSIYIRKYSLGFLLQVLADVVNKDA